MRRLDELRTLYHQTRASLDEVEPDKRASLIREARFLLQEIEAIQADMPDEAPQNPLDELRARRSKKSA